VFRGHGLIPISTAFAGVDEQQLVLQAAYPADARWAASLAPFVQQAGQSLLPRHHDLKFFGFMLHQVAASEPGRSGAGPG
jgi:hypothetical protein